ncbi:PfkB family carbohydrate kinase [Streptomyces blattellae]|uniref:PfkB family carbohydrate kinase n=1 Tax=Streptomyces blattellae TaxID=2569855 RepID=UPI0012B798C3|nr:PfkB family carbohydrate kinase [Streptomyces blattellae]
MAEAQPYDLITMGRVGIDLYPLRSRVPLTRAETFGGFLGDAAADVAVAATGLGRSAAVLTCTGDDPDEMDYFAVRAARVFWITGTGLSHEPRRSAVLAALKARGRAGITVFDLDWRPQSWSDPDEARPYYAEALRHATVAVGTLDECETMTGVREPQACARALLDAGVETAVVRQGAEGVLAVRRDGTTAEVPPAGVGPAGGHDGVAAFGGALCHGLLSGWDLATTVRYAAVTPAPTGRPSQEVG